MKEAQLTVIGNGGLVMGSNSEKRVLAFQRPDKTSLAQGLAHPPGQARSFCLMCVGHGVTTGGLLTPGGRTPQGSAARQREPQTDLRGSWGSPARFPGSPAAGS